MKQLLILGAMSDMAQAIAYEFAGKGYNITLAARNSERCGPLKSDLEIKHEGKVSIAEFDASNLSSHASFYQSLPEKPSLVACVFGYLGDHDLAKTDAKEAQRILMVNYNGAVSILDIIAADMEERKSGGIIGISSVAGDRGRADNYYYGSAKAGLTAYLSGLRGRLYQAGVHVMTVKPGFVDTQMTKDLDLPGALTASPEKVAKDIFRSFQKKKNTIYTLWMWRYVMLIIQHIPEFIFKKLSFGHGKSAEG